MLICFGIFLIIFFIIIEIICVLFRSTGLSESKARFQVISLLTGTGFTTKESELISQHPTRRKLAQIVMIVGYIGSAALISFIINIIKNSLDFYDICFIISGVAAITFFIKNKRFLFNLDVFIEKLILKTRLERNSKNNIYTLLNQNKGYGIYNLLLEENCFLINKSLKDSNLKQQNIQVLNVDKGNIFIPFPPTNYIFEKGDNILVYGENISIINVFKLK